MGLETLIEAAKYLEYKAEVEARGESTVKNIFGLKIIKFRANNLV